jgi:type I restriction enzyme R subunit
MSELEWKTRRDRINTRLTNLSEPWTIRKHKDGLDTSALDRVAVEEYPTENGPADYALFVAGRLLGIIEAKKVSVGAQNVLDQAKRYSQGATYGAGKWGKYRVPFLYATNGERFFFIDVRDPQAYSREISSFHTPSALLEFVETDHLTSGKAVNEPKPIYGIRPYQQAAIEQTEKAIRAGKREMLIAMATGTGKTFLTVAQVYRLLKMGLARRVLFLVDRRALAAQAFREFSSFTTPSGTKFNQEYEVYTQRIRKEDLEEGAAINFKELPPEYLKDPKPSHTFVYICTVQRMAINLFGSVAAFKQDSTDPDLEDDADRLDIPIHAFDLIIADECHRGYTASEEAIYRETVEHFDAVKIGLTATPAPHTLSLFKEIVYRYGTEQAIQDGYLVDYEAVKIKSSVYLNGVFLKPGEGVQNVDTTTGALQFDLLEDERHFDSADIEKKITAPDANRKIIKEIARYARQHEQDYGRFPKILIFAANDLPHMSHADQVVDLCRKEFGQGDAFVTKITASPSVDRPLQRIREFRNRPEPKVAVTVSLLSTGVDIPSLEFIVFMRPVKSRLLWVQMLGRGTRLCPDINKSHFTIFDCFDGSLIEYFRNTTDFNVEPPQKEIVPIEQIIRNIDQNVDRKYWMKVLVKRLHRVARDMSGSARVKFEAFIPDGDVGAYAKRLPELLHKSFNETIQNLKKKPFQELLVNYERAKRTFIVAPEVEDEVSSEVLIHGQRPEDYLESFEEFVRQNADQVEAIKVLLRRPKDWKTDVLNDLRIRLREGGFPEDDLRKAHKMVYHKALADIISMVKHAAIDSVPILSAEERVSITLRAFREGRQLNSEQHKWLEFVAIHLSSNLTLDMKDFEEQPIFSLRGGLRAAVKTFGSDLEEVVLEINRLMAA